MMIFRLLATCFGIGYIQKGAGTVAALFCCLIWWILRFDQTSEFQQLVYIVALFIAGTLSASKVETAWGHDSNRVVIDEWMGMALSLFLVPFTWVNFAIAFVLFRAFDIGKPFFIRRAEKLPGGWGVMMDDVLAGIYSLILLHLLLKTGLL